MRAGLRLPLSAHGPERCGQGPATRGGVVHWLLDDPHVGESGAGHGTGGGDECKWNLLLQKKLLVRICLDTALMHLGAKAADPQ